MIPFILLIWNMTMFWKSWILTFWPHPRTKVHEQAGEVKNGSMKCARTHSIIGLNVRQLFWKAYTCWFFLPEWFNGFWNCTGLIKFTTEKIIVFVSIQLREQIVHITFTFMWVIKTKTKFWHLSSVCFPQILRFSPIKYSASEAGFNITLGILI